MIRDKAGHCVELNEDRAEWFSNELLNIRVQGHGLHPFDIVAIKVDDETVRLTVEDALKLVSAIDRKDEEFQACWHV